MWSTYLAQELTDDARPTRLCRSGLIPHSAHVRRACHHNCEVCFSRWHLVSLTSSTGATDVSTPGSSRGTVRRRAVARAGLRDEGIRARPDRRDALAIRLRARVRARG